MFKRSLAVLMAFVMLVGMMPIAAFAVQPEWDGGDAEGSMSALILFAEAELAATVESEDGEGLAPGTYWVTTGAAITLQVAIDDATAVVAPEESDFNTLASALSVFLSARTLVEEDPEVPVDKTELTDAIAQADAKMLEADYSTKYTEETRDILTIALNAGIIVELDEDATQEEVDLAKDAILDALAGLEEEEVEPEVDKAELDALVSTIGDLVEVQYTEESWDLFIIARDNAMLLEEETQEQVDLKVQALEEAIDLLEWHLPFILAQFEIIDELNEEDYTPESWADLMTAIQNVEAGIAEGTITFLNDEANAETLAFARDQLQLAEPGELILTNLTELVEYDQALDLERFGVAVSGVGDALDFDIEDLNTQELIDAQVAIIAEALVELYTEQLETRIALAEIWDIDAVRISADGTDVYVHQLWHTQESREAFEAALVDAKNVELRTDFEAIRDLAEALKDARTAAMAQEGTLEITQEEVDDILAIVGVILEVAFVGEIGDAPAGSIVITQEKLDQLEAGKENLENATLNFQVSQAYLVLFDVVESLDGVEPVEINLEVFNTKYVELSDLLGVLETSEEDGFDVAQGTMWVEALVKALAQETADEYEEFEGLTQNQVDAAVEVIEAVIEGLEEVKQDGKKIDITSEMWTDLMIELSGYASDEDILAIPEWDEESILDLVAGTVYFTVEPNFTELVHEMNEYGDIDQDDVEVQRLYAFAINARDTFLASETVHELDTDIIDGALQVHAEITTGGAIVISVDGSDILSNQRWIATYPSELEDARQALLAFEIDEDTTQRMINEVVNALVDAVALTFDQSQFGSIPAISTEEYDAIIEEIEELLENWIAMFGEMTVENYVPVGKFYSTLEVYSEFLNSFDELKVAEGATALDRALAYPALAELLENSGAILNDYDTHAYDLAFTTLENAIQAVQVLEEDATPEVGVIYTTQEILDIVVSVLEGNVITIGEAMIIDFENATAALNGAHEILLDNLTVGTKLPQAAPTGITTVAATNETGTNGQILGVTPAMQYRLIGLSQWEEITGTVLTNVVGGVYEISYKETDTHLESPFITVQVHHEPPTVDKPAQEAPTGLGSTSPTSSANSNGTITGVTAAMEYKLASTEEWLPITGTTVTGLANGTYLVRFKETDELSASPAVSIVVSAYSAPPSSGGSSGGGTVTTPPAGGGPVAPTAPTTPSAPVEQAQPGTTVNVTVTNGKATLNEATVSEAIQKNLDVRVTNADVSITMPSSIFAGATSVEITVAPVPQARATAITTALGNRGFTLMSEPVMFSTVVDNQPMNKFDQFITREFKLGSNLSARDVSTAVVINADNTVRPVPTTVVVRNGETYVQVKSLSNSVYAIVSKPVSVQSVAGRWSAPAVNTLAERMIITNPIAFSPRRDMTRGDFAVYMANALGLEDVAVSGTFSDVTVNNATNRAIEALADRELVNGYTDGTFRPNATITRAEMAVMTARASKYFELQGANPNLIRNFKDADTLAPWAAESMREMVSFRIYNGFGDGTLRPNETITHEQGIQVIYNVLKNVGIVE